MENSDLEKPSSIYSSQEEEKSGSVFINGFHHWGIAFLLVALLSGGALARLPLSSKWPLQEVFSTESVLTLLAFGTLLGLWGSAGLVKFHFVLTGKRYLHSLGWFLITAGLIPLTFSLTLIFSSHGIPLSLAGKLYLLGNILMGFTLWALLYGLPKNASATLFSRSRKKDLLPLIGFLGLGFLLLMQVIPSTEIGNLRESPVFPKRLETICLVFPWLGTGWALARQPLNKSRRLWAWGLLGYVCAQMISMTQAPGFYGVNNERSWELYWIFQCLGSVLLGTIWTIAWMRTLSQHGEQSLRLAFEVRSLEDFNQTAETLRQAAESSTRTKSEFLANMSHEIRTPMTAILGFSEMLLGNLKTPEEIACARTIQRNGEFLLEILNDILDLSKIEIGKMEINPIECSPHQIIQDVMALMKHRADAKGLPLEWECIGTIPKTIQTDPVRFRQILFNLLGNGIKFTEVGRVLLRVQIIYDERKKPFLMCEVIDSGIGMTPEQVGRLFRPFTQADASTTRNYGGTGLGLCISKRLSEMLGGAIEVSSTFGQGSTFCFTLQTGPLEDVEWSDPKENPTTDSAPPDEKKSPSEISFHGERILLAEDGPDNQRFISFLLKKAGAAVDIAPNGKVAVEKALATQNEGLPYSVILMDMQMPIQDGYDATRELREKNYTAPVIALTAHAMSGDRDKCLAAGCDEYLSKPINKKNLLEMVYRFAHSNSCSTSGKNPAKPNLAAQPVEIAQ